MKGLIRESQTPEAKAWLAKQAKFKDNPYFNKLDPAAKFDDQEELTGLLKMVDSIFYTKRCPGHFVTYAKLGLEGSPDFSLDPSTGSAMSLLSEIHERGVAIYDYLAQPNLQVNNSLFLIPSLVVLNAAHQCAQFNLPEVVVQYGTNKRLHYTTRENVESDEPFDNAIFIPPVKGAYWMLPDA